MAFLLKNSFKLLLYKRILNTNLLDNHQLPQQGFKTASVALVVNKQNPDANKSKETSKKNKVSVKITLFQNENMTVTGLEDAKNLAKRRSMHLVKVQDMDSKTQRPVYKLLTAAEMLQNELSEITQSKSDKSAKKKSEKILNIGSRIAEHDLSSRLKNISKWLSKQHEVRILIQATSEQDLSNAEKIFNTIEESIKSPQVIGKIVQKVRKGNILKFNISPVVIENQENPVSITQ